MDLLNRPVWNALRSRQADFAIGDALAVRMAPQYGPFAAAADASPDSLSALAALIPSSGEIWLVETGPVIAPNGTSISRDSDLVQMVARQVTQQPHTFDIIPLSKIDGPEIHALATLTAPGPSHECTNELGRFVGIKLDGRLVAMAGERMRPPGYTEVSGVCTHPEFRGRGYAAALMRHVAATIIADGDVPFLHSYATNSEAIALYEKLGFRTHRTIIATILRKP